jgi:BASS family bile acid:Na+ symporter
MHETLIHVFRVLLAVTVPLASFATGMRAPHADVTWLWHRPSLLVRSLLSVLVLVPVGTLAFVELARLPPPLPGGLMAAVLAIGIGPAAMFRRTSNAELVHYEVSLDVALLGLSIIFLPLAAALLGVLFHRHVWVGPGRVAWVVLSKALVPMALGIVAGRLWPKAAARASHGAAIFVNIALLLIVLLALAGSWHAMATVGAVGWMAVVAVALGALAVGHGMGGPETSTRAVLAAYSAMRFPALALLLAMAAPAGRKLFPVVLAYVMVSIAMVTLYGAILHRRARRRARPAARPLETRTA